MLEVSEIRFPKALRDGILRKFAEVPLGFRWCGARYFRNGIVHVVSTPRF